jgi:hypothetical protein
MPSWWSAWTTNAGSEAQDDLEAALAEVVEAYEGEPRDLEDDLVEYLTDHPPALPEGGAPEGDDRDRRDHHRDVRERGH